MHMESIVSPLRLRWVKGECEFNCNLAPALVYVLTCNLPPAVLEGCPRSFVFHCGNTGVERKPTKSAQKVNSCRVSNLRPSDHESHAVLTQLSQPPSPPPSRKKKKKKKNLTAAMFLGEFPDLLDFCNNLCGKCIILMYHSW